MQSKIAFALLVTALAVTGCGGTEENNGANNGNNGGSNNGGSNNGGSNNGGSNNGGTNNGGTNNGGTNNGATNNGGGGAGTATVNFNMTVGDRAAQITDCSFANGTAQNIKVQTGVAGERIVTIQCSVGEAGSFTGFFIATITFFSTAVGNTDAADLLVQCSGNGCMGTGDVHLRYQDGAAGVLEENSAVAATTKTGSLTVDTYDDATGATAGSVDITFSDDDREYTISGTFSANVFDCADAPVCSGNGM